MKAYKDLAGTQLAKDGDRVALVVGPDKSEWRQSSVSKRPALRDGSPCFEGAEPYGGDVMRRKKPQ